MKCYGCGSIFKTKRGNLTCSYEFIGDVTIADAEWEECPKCHEQLFNSDILDALALARDNKLIRLTRTGEKFTGNWR